MTNKYKDALELVEGDIYIRAFGETFKFQDRELKAIQTALQDKIDGGWLPIESAPKDGTEIIVFEPKGKHRGDTHTYATVHWYDDSWHSVYCVDHWLTIDRPTHWTLPTPPEINKQMATK